MSREGISFNAVDEGLADMDFNATGNLSKKGQDILDIFDYVKGNLGLDNDLDYQGQLWRSFDEDSQKARREEVLLRLSIEGYDLDEVFLSNELLSLGDLVFDLDRIRAEIESIKYRMEDRARSKADIAERRIDEEFARLLQLMGRLGPADMHKVLNAIIAGTKVTDPDILSNFIDEIEDLLFMEGFSEALDEQWESEMEALRQNREDFAVQEEAKEREFQEEVRLLKIELQERAEKKLKRDKARAEFDAIVADLEREEAGDVEFERELDLEAQGRAQENEDTRIQIAEAVENDDFEGLADIEEYLAGQIQE